MLRHFHSVTAGPQVFTGSGRELVDVARPGGASKEELVTTSSLAKFHW